MSKEEKIKNFWWRMLQNVQTIKNFVPLAASSGLAAPNALPTRVAVASAIAWWVWKKIQENSHANTSISNVSCLQFIHLFLRFSTYHFKIELALLDIGNQTDCVEHDKKQCRAALFHIKQQDLMEHLITIHMHHLIINKSLRNQSEVLLIKVLMVKILNIFNNVIIVVAMTAWCKKSQALV